MFLAGGFVTGAKISDSLLIQFVRAWMRRQTPTHSQKGMFTGVYNVVCDAAVLL